MYRSVSDFALECMRIKLHELKQQKIERQKLNIYFKTQKEKKNQTPNNRINGFKLGDCQVLKKTYS